VDLAAFGMVPAHRDFAEPQPGAVREKKQFDIEGESIDASGFQNWAARVHTERLETTLRVPKRKIGGKTNKQIKNAASLLAPPGLMLANQPSIQTARAKRDVDSPLAIGSITLVSPPER
jgi:hypothetical protein